MIKLVCIHETTVNIFQERNWNNFFPHTIKIGDLVESDLEDSHDGTYTIYINIEAKKYWFSPIILDANDWFVTLAEWRDKQINEILE